MPDKIASLEAKIWQVVGSIPSGKVATYGQVAELAGAPQQSRMVGRILSRLPPGTKLPWHRVINSQGRISNPSPRRQIDRLADEGVAMVRGRVNLRLYRWHPGDGP